MMKDSLPTQLLVRDAETGKMYPPTKLPDGLSEKELVEHIDNAWRLRYWDAQEFGDPRGHIHMETAVETPGKDLLWLPMPCTGCALEDVRHRQVEYDNAPGIVRLFRARPIE